jgi:site-specific DNA recombinase
MICAVYARKSTDDSERSEEARSTTRQVERATEYARANGWTVDPRYVFVDEAVSGAEWQRRGGLKRLLASLDNGATPFGVLVVSELSRIGRDSVRVSYVVQQIEEAGVEIHGYLSGQRITVDDELGEMQTMLHALAASFERRRARQRTHDALRRRAQVGAATGGRMFGYVNHRNRDGYVHRVIEKSEATVIQRIFALAADGSPTGRACLGKRRARRGGRCKHCYRGASYSRRGSATARGSTRSRARARSLR